nr:DNA cytosine methyltransferase [Capnocytophaga canimorsus]
MTSEPRKMNHTELIRCQSFPQDYDFGTSAYSFVQYVLGMSVPPVMMANLVDEIYKQWRKIFENE